MCANIAEIRPTAKGFDSGAAIARTGTALDPSSIVARLVFWIVLLVAILMAANALGVTAVSEMFESLVTYIPNVIVAVLILTLAFVLSEFVKDVIMAALGGVTGAEILARIAKAAIIILAIFMILDQLQIAEDIVATAFARPTAKKAVPGAGRPVFPASDEESLHGSGRCLYPVRRRTCSMDRTLDPLILEAIARTVSSRPEIAAVYVYGSAARGEATPLSDVDLALLFVEDQSERERRELLAQITGDLARHGAGPRLDVRDFEDLPLTVQGRVLAEGALVQSNDDVRRVRFETLVRMQYFDFLPFHRRDIEEGLHFLRRRFGG